MNKKQTKYLAEDVVQKLLSYIKNQADSARKKGSSRPIIDELIIHLLLNTGLRPNELCNLHIEDLPIIHGKNYIWIRNSNEEVNRKILVNNEFIELLNRFITLYRIKANQKDLLLQSERDNPFSYMSLYSKMRKIGTESGIGKLSPAILRYTYIRRLYDVKQDLRYVQQQAGYTSRRTLHKCLFCKGREVMQKCEACGEKMEIGKGKRIDSGQLICPDCQKYFEKP